MANTIQIKNGASAPTSSQLANYELGYMRGGSLYINNGGIIVQLANPNTVDLVNSNNYLKLPAIAATTSNTGRILVADSSGVVYYKTPANIRKEIGAFASTGGTVSGATTFSSTVTVSGLLTANGAIVVDTNSYGTTDPNTANNGSALSGSIGQLYFVLTE